MPPFALQFHAKSSIAEANIFCKSFQKTCIILFFSNILKIEQESRKVERADYLQAFFPDFSFPAQFKTKKVRLRYVKKFAISINDFESIHKRHPAMPQKYHI